MSPVSNKKKPHTEEPSDVAIIGLGCLLPKAQNARVLWDNILKKVNAIQEVPKERWDLDLYYDSDPKTRDKIYSKWGGFIDEVPFDPMRYGIPPKALSSIDPFQLLALEVVHQALEDAGYGDREFSRERTSVIFGVSGGLGDLGLYYGFRSCLPMFLGADVSEQVLQQLPEWTEDSFAGTLVNVSAGRVANRFDLGGVNFTVDAACASSLAAVYLAARELENGTSDMVIVGGVDTVQNPFAYLCFAKTQALSPDGLCKTFDEKANGIVISEGVAILVLKRLADAERDGDRIYAVLKSVAGSSDGRGKGLTAPKPGGQIRALERAYAKAGFSPATVGLIEAHGTGTVAGDAAEVTSLSQLFQAAHAAPQGCALGSIKSMIGHTKSAAGVAGVMKAALALHHKVLPPTLNVESPNPKMRGNGTPFYVNTEPLPWFPQAGNIPRRAGVSSFGFGGTNFHAVLEEHGSESSDSTGSLAEIWPSELFFWKADDAAQLLANLESLNHSLEGGVRPALSDLAANICGLVPPLDRQPSEKVLNLAIIASSLEDLKSKLRVALDSVRAGCQELSDGRGIYLGSPFSEGKVAFLFPGQGSQHPYMLRNLSLHFQDLRQSFEKADRVLWDRFEGALTSYLFPPPPFSREEEEAQMRKLTDTRIAQPALGAAEIGLFHLLTRLGVEPDMAAGHSYGEYVALCAAGVFSEEALFAVSEARGRFIKESVAEEAGTMAAVNGDAELVTAALEGIPNVWAANLNGPRQTIIAGRVEDVESARATLEESGFRTRPIPVACAFHSPLMEPARARLARFLETVEFQPARFEVFSNALACRYPKEPQQIREVLADHLVRPLQFTTEIEAMYEAGARVFVEVGPRNVLTGLLRQILEERNALCIATDLSGRDGIVQLLHTLGQLAVRGLPVKLRTLYQARSPRPIDLEELEKESKAKRPLWYVNGGRVRSTVLPQGPPAAANENRADTTGPLHAKGRSGDAAVLPPPTGSEHLPAHSRPAKRAAETVPGPNLEASTYNQKNGGTETLKPDVSQSNPRGTESTAVATIQGMPVAAIHSDTVMMRFQQLMSQFLQTQNAVMTAYLQNGVPEGENQGFQHAQPQLQQLQTVLAPPPPLPSTPVVSAPPRNGRKPEAAAGTDEPAPSPQAPPPAPSFPAQVVAAEQPDPTDSRSIQDVASGDEDDFSGRLLRIVSERTGYPEEMLDLDSNIEADLGIDSIKRVEILSAFQRALSPDRQRRIEGLMETLSGLKTLREIAGYLSEAPGSSNGTEL
ncbi:MAG: type I polyketide synthase [Acidobacteriota bacterium]